MPPFKHINATLREDSIMSVPETRKRCPVYLQLPGDLYTELRSYAAADERSLNWQVNHILQAFFREKKERLAAH